MKIRQILTWCLSVILTAGAFSDSGIAEETAIRADWEPLIHRLVTDGEDEDTVRAVFSHAEVTFDPRVMPRKLTHKESRLNYGKFLKPGPLRRARTFLKRNRKLLEDIEAEFGVPKEIKVAILLVETDLGTYLGGGLALNILGSMALASDIERMTPWLPPELLTPEERSGVEKRLKDKSEWAYQELRALLKYTRENGLDIYTLKGSIFGAIGLCQFMPSNALRYGVDYDGDGKVDLFSKGDAIASMANYVKSYGWGSELTHEEQVRVILKYNYSRPYANTILDVALRLGWTGYHGKPPSSSPG